MRGSVFALAAGAAAAFAAASAADAATFLVTYENAGVQASTSTFAYAGQETFTNRSTTGTASTTDFVSRYGTGLAISGSYDNVSVLNADQYGGAGGGGKYAAAWNGAGASTSYAINLSTLYSSGLNYFGLWLSAADAGNRIQFYNDNSLLYSFSTADLLAQLSSRPGSSAYFGNPNGNNDGVSSGQAYAFLNFYDTSGTFNRVVLSEESAFSGFESDNHTVARYASVSGTALGPVPEPASWAMMILGFGMVGSVLRARRARDAVSSNG